MNSSTLSEYELAEATLAELTTRSARGVRFHCLGTVATALGTLGIVASLDGGVGDWRRIAIWSMLIVATAGVLWWALVSNRVVASQAVSFDRGLIACGSSGLLVGSVGFFDLSAMQHESFAYALCATTLAYCAGALVNLHPLSVLIGASIIPAVGSLAVSLFVTGNVMPGICSLVVLGIFAQALPPMRRMVDELVRSRLIAQHASTHDPLTGVRNRAGLQPALVDACSLVYGDIDGFKQINDQFGHGIGDQVIKEVAARLSHVAGGHDALTARVGGDEFVVVSPSAERDSITALANDIARAMAEPFAVVGTVGFSCGTATRAECSPDSLGRLFSDADKALYRSKAAKSAQWVEHVGLPTFDSTLVFTT